MDPRLILPSARNGSFTVVIAPREVLAAFLVHRTGKEGTPVPFICMDGAVVPPCSDLAVRVAGTPEEYLQALRSVRAALVCVAYHPAACGPQGEDAGEFAAVLRHVAVRSEVLLHATARDPALDAVAGQADRVICTNLGPGRTLQPRRVRGRQTTFGEVPWGEASEA
jgi:hypothetical protein